MESQPRPISVIWLANQLKCDRRNIYNIYRRDSIDTSLLYRLSKILNHDFFLDISNEMNREPGESLAMRAFSATMPEREQSERT